MNADKIKIQDLVPQNTQGKEQSQGYNSSSIVEPSLRAFEPICF